MQAVHITFQLYVAACACQIVVNKCHIAVCCTNVCWRMITNKEYWCYSMSTAFLHAIQHTLLMHVSMLDQLILVYALGHPLSRQCNHSCVLMALTV